ncbi:MAG TPA: AMP-binding protein [Candidatus Methylomirabilis sp.]|nr:AMP-binding protein [Candidatus Methylomirabilis sp.]
MTAVGGAETIPGRAAAAAAAFGDALAMQAKGEAGYVRLTYRELAARAAATARGLVALGLKPGDRAVLLSENRPEWGVAYLAITGAGGTAVPLDPHLSDAEIANCVRHAGAELVVTSGHFRERLAALAAQGLTASVLDLDGGPGALSLGALAERGAGALLPEVLADTPASILYTSGTTGTPKGVVLTHRNFLANAESVLGSIPPRRDDVFLSLLPLHHAFPFMANFLVPLLSGACTVFLQSLKAPDLLACMQETGVTILVGVPQLYAMLHRGLWEQIGRRPAPARAVFRLLLAASDRLLPLTGERAGRLLFRQVHRRFGGRLRIMASGGAKLDPAVAADFRRLGFQVLEGYGLTETAPVVSFNPPERPVLESIGRPLSGVEVRIGEADADGVGEILVRGPNVMSGYYRNPEATAEALRDGWLHTGDLGYLDARNYLFITGRAKEVIVLPSGKNIYPEEVEAHYLQSPYIKEICVVGVEAGGEAGVATESLRALVLPDFDYLKAQRLSGARDAIRWDMENYSRRLPAYKRVTGFSLVKDSFPRTRLGKIQRHRVQELYRDLLAAPPSPAEPAEVPGDPLLERPGADRILQLLTERAKGRPVRLDDNLELDLGIDSLGRVELVVALEEMFGIELPDETGSEVFTVRELLGKVLEVAAGGKVPAPTRRSPWEAILNSPPDAAAQARLAAGTSGRAGVVSWFVQHLCWLLFILFCRLRVRGRERVPVAGPFILASNHASYIDGFVIAAAVPYRFLTRLYYVGFQTFFQHPIMDWFARNVRVIAIDMDAYLARALQMAAHVLREGKVLCVFPEGSRSIDGTVKPFKKGTGILALGLKVPLVPVYLQGTFDVWPRGERWPRPGPVRVTFGEPASVDDLLRDPAAVGADEPERLMAALRARVAALAGPVAAGQGLA